MRHCKAELFKITQSRGFLGALLGKSAGLLMKVTVPLTKNVSTSLENMTLTSVIDGAT